MLLARAGSAGSCNESAESARCQTANTGRPDAKIQTAKVLEKIDGFLEKAVIDTTRLVSAQVWLADIGRDFAGMNEGWDAWVPDGCAPTRAMVEAKLAAPALPVEIAVVARG
jgi:enamine deaminase RidA (YjgF/YER057c/UK114 family)